MTRSTKELSGEHKNILKVIDAMTKECDALEGGKELEKEFFVKAVDFIRNYADKFHHAKEEDILFKELDHPEVQMHCDPRGQMLHEHDMGRKFVKGMEEGAADGDKSKAVENARGYAQLLQEHIHKEDNILYPMAEQALGEERSRAVGERFAKVNEKYASANEKYLALVEEFSSRPVAS